VARIRERVARLAETARGIRLDGKADDWEGFHRGAATVVNPGTRRAHDLTMAIAPTDSEILFCIEGGGPPGGLFREWNRIDITISVQVGRWEALQVGLRRDSRFAWTWRRDQPSRIQVPSGAVTTVEGECLEGRILLEPLLKGTRDMASEEWAGTRCSPALSVELTLDATGKEKEEEFAGRRLGPKVSSYRLSPSRFRPSWAGPPPSGRGFARCRFFLDGKWCVLEGPDEWPTHEGVIAYDLVIKDGRGMTFRGDSIRRNEDSYSWGAPVYAPTEGIVVVSEEGNEDLAPLGDMLRWKEVRGYKANGLSVAGPIGWMFSHLQKGSVTKATSEDVKEGEVVARVGNSASTGPHLHCKFWSGEDLVGTGLAGDVPGARLVLQDVFVGLNPGPDDPWEVRLPEWLVETGYYVRKAEPAR
jgi:hypothetical protein